MTEEMKRVMELQRANAFGVYNHMELESVENGRVVLRLNIHESSKNPLGIVHGGAMYAMADSAAGFAANLGEGRYVTQSSTMHYLGNCREGMIRAAAQVIHQGRSTSLVKVEVTNEQGKLLATGDFTFFALRK